MWQGRAVGYIRTMSSFTAQNSFSSLATEIAEDLAMWPMGMSPSRVLQINEREAGTIVADIIPYTSLTILSQEPVNFPGKEHRFKPIDVRIGDWSKTEWGEGYDIVLCFDFLRHLIDRDRISFLTRAQRSLARGGRTLAIELVTPGDIAARELQHAGLAAGCERVLVSSMATDESWSAVVFERDRWSAWHVD